MNQASHDFILADGRVMSSGELTQFYRENWHSGQGPMAGYFCPYCNHELTYVHDMRRPYICTHCSDFGGESR